MNNKIFITGGTGYIGRRLIPELLKRNYEVFALVRKNSIEKLPNGCIPIIGNALDQTTFIDQVIPCKTFIHLVGVPHPSPAKKELFKKIDLVSIRESVAAATHSCIEHFIYMSVAQETNLMKAYQEVRAEGESLITKSGMNATIFRPWYVIGPGHYWPLVFLPVFKLLEWIPATEKKAKLTAFVSINQLISAITFAVEHPPSGSHIVSVPSIEKMGSSAGSF